MTFDLLPKVHFCHSMVTTLFALKGLHLQYIIYNSIQNK